MVSVTCSTLKPHKVPGPSLFWLLLGLGDLPPRLSVLEWGRKAAENTSVVSLAIVLLRSCVVWV